MARESSSPDFGVVISVTRVILIGMNNAQVAWIAAAVLLSVIIPLRLVVQSQRGTLDWNRERPVLIAAPLFLFAAAVLLASGRVVQLVGPPLVLTFCGAALIFYDSRSTARLGPLTLRQFGLLVVLVGGLGVVVGILRSAAG